MVLLSPRRADACGGCFTESVSQVTGHRMVLSLGNTQTTLYDQFEYTGRPSSFAWVLPIKGVVEVGLSSDLLFNGMDAGTAVTIFSPMATCSGGGFPCSYNYSAAGGGSVSMIEGDMVDVLAQETVGPYETVQLASSDGSALLNWLASHGYNVPQDIEPVIDAYVAEGFDFLALRLVPGVGVEAMRPVRVTIPGAAPVLPLRMVAAGTGVTTTVTLWVISEGRYQPANFPWFVIDEVDLLWNWDTQSSNYSEIRQQAYDDSNGFAWLVESTWSFNPAEFISSFQGLVASDPADSGYGDGDPQLAIQEASADMNVLLGSLDPNTLWFTRLRAELSRPALATDLQLEAADSQTPIWTERYIQNAQGTPPCPPVRGGGGTNCSTSSGGEGASWPAMSVSANDDSATSCACSFAKPENRAFLLVWLFLVVPLARRSTRASSRRR